MERDRARSGGVEGGVWVLEKEKDDRGCGEKKKKKKEGEEEEEIKKEMGV